MSQLLEKVTNADMRLDYCEYCGNAPGYFETHHIKSVGSGGPDIRANKINLCVFCHVSAQEYKIKPYELIIIIARREKVTVKEVCDATTWAVPENLEELEDIASSENETTKTVEDLLNYLIVSEQTEQDSRFLRGEVIELLVRRGIKKSWIASQTGKSTAHIRNLHKTYLAFPDEASRVPSLTWSHHKIAAYTDAPQEWIDVAASGTVDGSSDEYREMSVKDLRKAIIDKDIDEGKIPPEEPTDELTDKRIKKIVDDVTSIIEQGGEASERLLAELSKFVKRKEPALSQAQ